MTDHREGLALLRGAPFEEAAQAFKSALAHRPDDKTALLGLGDALSVLGHIDEARRVFERLLARDPAAAHFGLGALAKQRGRFDEARAFYERAVALAPDNAAYHRALAESARFSEGDPRLAVLEQLARDEAKLADKQKVELHFALFKAYDDLQRYAEAFAHLRQGNAIKRRLVEYDAATMDGFFGEIAAAFSADTMQALRGTGHSSQLPIFVVGMPRSGTSLVEQILASHPAVFGAGELTFVQDAILGGGQDYPRGISALPGAAFCRFGEAYAARLEALTPKAERIVDKLPANFRHLGLIHLALPQARIIHVKRDAMDTCFSCYSKLFLGGLNYTYDLGELGRYHKSYEALMAHWRHVLPPGAMIEVQYETLIRDFENEVRRMIAFCGLNWNARCLDFHQTERAVRTLSDAQVRQTLFDSSIGRWRRYETWLGDLIAVLRD
jgi:tetratricopeptide (TPR) repeat protein